MDDSGEVVRFKSRMKLVLFFVFLVVVLFAAGVIVVIYGHEGWIKNQIVSRIEASLDAEVEIESFELDLRNRKAVLGNVVIDAERPDVELNINAETIEIGFELKALLGKEVKFERVDVGHPIVRVNHSRVAEEEAIPTLVRLENFFIGELVEAYIEMLLAILDALFGPHERRVVVGELVVDEGEVYYTAIRSGAERFECEVRDSKYLARDLEPELNLDLVRDADLEGNIVMGGMESEFVMRNLTSPQEFSVSGIDLGYLDRYLSQTDALVVDGGIINVRYSGQVAQVEFEDLKLGKNSEAKFNEFAFVQVEKLISYVDEGEGKILLEMKVEADKIRTSEDLRFAVRQAWKGLVKQVFERYGEPAKEKIKEYGGKVLKRFLDRGEESSEKDE